jgi:GNAT superfamily N-acetyltransferase
MGLDTRVLLTLKTALPPAAPNVIQLRPETADDEPFLRRLFETTRALNLASKDWPELEKSAFCHMQYDAQHRYFRAEYPNALNQIIQRDGKPLGRIYIHHGKAEVLILDISLLPEHCGAGIGSALLRGLQRAAAKAGQKLTIQIERSSRLLNLLQRHGFLPHEICGAGLLLKWDPPAVARDN